jgi:hypothetical protein
MRYILYEYFICCDHANVRDAQSTSFVSSNFILYLLPRGLVLSLCLQRRHQTPSHFTIILHILQRFCPIESV